MTFLSWWWATTAPATSARRLVLRLMPTAISSVVRVLPASSISGGRIACLPREGGFDRSFEPAGPRGGLLVQADDGPCHLLQIAHLRGCRRVRQLHDLSV